VRGVGFDLSASEVVDRWGVFSGGVAGDVEGAVSGELGGVLKLGDGIVLVAGELGDRKVYVRQGFDAGF
jgi:hypothetical protein